MQRFPLPADARYSYAQGFTQLHHGVDIMAPAGTPVLAVERGRAWSSVEPKGGNVVYLEAVNGTRYFFGHLDSVAPLLWHVTSAAPVAVAAGDELGKVGTSGNAAGRPPHLHFQTRRSGLFGGQVVNPYAELMRADPNQAGVALEPEDLFNFGIGDGARKAVALAIVLWAVSKRS